MNVGDKVRVSREFVVEMSEDENIRGGWSRQMLGYYLNQTVGTIIEVQGIFMLVDFGDSPIWRYSKRWLEPLTEEA